MTCFDIVLSGYPKQDFFWIRPKNRAIMLEISKIKDGEL